MSFNQGGGRPNFKAASAIGQYLPVGFAGLGSAAPEQVKLCGSVNDVPFGISMATAASPGDPLTIAPPGEYVKAIALASLGAGALVGVGSANGKLIPIIPSGVASGGAAVVLRWAVGIAIDDAAAGDIFTVFVKPDQVV